MAGWAYPLVPASGRAPPGGATAVSPPEEHPTCRGGRRSGRAPVRAGDLGAYAAGKGSRDLSPGGGPGLPGWAPVRAGAGQGGRRREGQLRSLPTEEGPACRGGRRSGREPVGAGDLGAYAAGRGSRDLSPGGPGGAPGPPGRETSGRNDQAPLPVEADPARRPAPTGQHPSY